MKPLRYKIKIWNNEVYIGRMQFSNDVRPPLSPLTCHLERNYLLALDS